MRSLKEYRKSFLILLVASAVFVVLSRFVPLSICNIMGRILIMMLFATSVNIMFGYTGLIAFGQSLFFGCAAFIYALLVVKARVAIYPAAVAAVAATALISLLIGLLVLRVQAFTFALLFMGVNILVYNVSMKMPILGSGAGVTGSLRPDGFANTRVLLYFILAVVAVCYILIFINMHSTFGTMAQGIRENEERMTFLGVNIKRVKLVSIVLAGTFSGVAGILYAMLNLGAFAANLALDLTIEGLIMCLVGGMFSFWGPSVGALLITFVNVWVSNQTIFYHAILGVVLIATILFMPNGIVYRHREGESGNWLTRKFRKAGGPDQSKGGEQA